MRDVIRILQKVKIIDILMYGELKTFAVNEFCN